MANIEATEARIATNVVRRSQLKFVAGIMLNPCCCSPRHCVTARRSYARYYNESRTHRSLNKNAAEHRAIERRGASRQFSVDFTTNIAESDFRYTQGLGLDQCPVDREVFARQQLADLRQVTDAGHELA